MTNSITLLRRSLGFGAPSWPVKELMFSRITSPMAGIEAAKGGYKPHPTQKRAHMSDARAVGVSGGWGSGKSAYAGFEGYTWMPQSALIWIMGKGYKICRPEFQYLAEAAVSSGLALPEHVRLAADPDKPCYLKSIPHDSSEGKVECLVETRTLSDVAKAATARRPDLIIVCEPGLLDDLTETMELLWGRVSERRGRIVIAGTSDESSEDWFEIWSSWQKENPEGGESYSMPTWENKRRYPRGRTDPEFTRYEERYGAEALMAHFGGVPAAPRGLVLRGAWSEDLVDPMLEHNPALPLEVCIDPNYSAPAQYSVEFVQWDPVNGEITIVDEISESGLTHPQMIERFREHPLSKYALSGTIDPYARESHVFGAPEPAEYWRAVIDVRSTYRPAVRSSVQALKEIMSAGASGRSRFRVSPKAKRFIWEATHWKLLKSGDPNKGACDAQKAFAYWAVDFLAAERRRTAQDDNINRPSDWGWGEGSRSSEDWAYRTELQEVYG